MKPPADAVQTEGQGPAVVFIHGTAADKTSWRMMVGLIRDRVRATTYDRRGTALWPIADGEPPPLVSDHADDVADVIVGLGTGPVHVCAISFGAVVALELAKQRPELVRSEVLFEPALAADDQTNSVPRYLLDEVERLSRCGDFSGAGEFFCQRAFGSHRWRRLPVALRNEMRSRGKQIRYDLLANAAYSPCYQELKSISAPVLLLKGGRSRKAFEPTLESLQRVLPQCECRLIDHAEHMPSGEAWREFAAALTHFIGA